MGIPNLIDLLGGRNKSGDLREAWELPPARDRSVPTWRGTAIRRRRIQRSSAASAWCSTRPADVQHCWDDLTARSYSTHGNGTAPAGHLPTCFPPTPSGALARGNTMELAPLQRTRCNLRGPNCVGRTAGHMVVGRRILPPALHRIRHNSQRRDLREDGLRQIVQPTAGPRQRHWNALH